MQKWWLEYPIAHRGLHDQVNERVAYKDQIPENSIPSFQKAVAKGFAIELDVRVLSDGTPVVFHDLDLMRMTNVSGKVTSLDIRSLKSLKLNKSTYTIPTLEEVLNFVDSRVPLLIELKVERDEPERPVDGLLDLLGSYRGDFAIQSFNPYVLKWINANRPSWKKGILTCDFESSNDLNFFEKFTLKNMVFLPQVRPDFIASEFNYVSNQYIQLLKKSLKYDILVWTIREKALFRQFKNQKYGVIFEGFIP